MELLSSQINLNGQHMRSLHIVINPQQSAEVPTLVFLHEGLGCLEMWKDFPQQICQALGLNGFVYERIGFGKSSPLGLVPRPINYLEREGRDILPAVLKQAGITNPVLIGHGDGGSIALTYAAYYPDSPVAVITEAAHVFVEDATLLGIKNAGDLYFKGGLKPELECYHGSNTDKAFRGWHDTWLTAEFANWNMENLLPKITAPLLVIQGINDKYGSQLQVQSIVENSTGPATPLMVPDCAHVPHFQSRAVVSANIIQFINQKAYALAS